MTSHLFTRPKQAVILAGGRGMRLRPLTDKIPKPMIRFHGKPFLEYLVEMLRNQGIERVLLLLGYLAEIVQSYFGDGTQWGIQIDYCTTDEKNETGRRIEIAKPYIDSTFLLMYCDNYWPLQLDRMWQTFSEQNALAMITVYSNRDDYSRSNVRLGSDGFVLTYDMTRSTHGLQGVEIGYALMSKVAFSVLCNENVPFESVVYPHLAARHQLLGYLTEHKYYSVGSHERLPLTAEFLARRPTLLLDRDGVLNKRMPQGQYVRSWDEWAWLPGSLEALRLLREANYRVIVISNQPGIARGAMTEAVLHEIDQNMKKQARKAGGDIAKSYYCTHGWHDECLCRKPRPGMLFHAQRDFHLDLTRTWFIGDDDRDAEAATMAGCPWLMVTAERSLLDFTLDLLKFVS